MLGHRLDHIEHAADLVAFLLEQAHRFGRLADFGSQAFDLLDCFAYHLVSLAGLLVGGDGGFGRLLGVTCHFLDGGGHLVHGRGNLVGFDFLVVDPGAGLFGDCRQFFGGAGDLGDTVADAADQLAQAQGHALQAALQLAELVATVGFHVLAQVAAGDSVDHPQGVIERDNDLPGNGERTQSTEQQGQGSDQAQHVLGVAGLVIALCSQGHGQLHAHVQQGLPQLLHVPQGLAVISTGWGLADVAEVASILPCGFDLAIDHGNIVGYLQLPADGLQACLEVVEGGGHRRSVLRRRLGLVNQAVDAQVPGQIADAGNRAELVATVDHAIEALPASEGDHQGQYQHQAEADAEFAVDAYIAQMLGEPTVHDGLLGGVAERMGG
ncbi:hypothetical protein D3C85_878730 [compost metagenome]